MTDAETLVVPLTLGDARELFERAIAVNGGGYIYEAPEGKDVCQYGEDTADGVAPSCLIGHLLNYLDPELLKKAHENYEGKNASAVVSALLPETGDRTLRYLDSVQEAQDAHVAWGEAILYE